MRGYQKRYYRQLSAFWRDLRVLAHDFRQIRALRTGKMIDKAFRERLMLAVTAVNGCRYCAYAHAKMALVAGVTQEDVDALAGGSLCAAPPEQIPALLYAQHWAETDASPDASVRQTVLETYGEERLRAIELSMRTIRVANLLGNTADYLLYRVSFGRWGDGRSQHGL